MKKQKTMLQQKKNNFRFFKKTGGNSVTIMKTNSLSFKSHKNPTNDFCFVVEQQTNVKSIAWFSKMARAENLTVDEVNDALDKFEDFFDQKKFEKAEIEAELQLAYAYQNVLEEKQAGLIGPVVFKQY